MTALAQTPTTIIFAPEKFVTSFCLQTQQNKFVNWQGDAEIRGEDFTATVTLGNPDVLVGSGGSYSRGSVEHPVCRHVNSFIHRLNVPSVQFSIIAECRWPHLTQTNFLMWSWTPCCPPVRYCCSPLPPVHNASSGSGRGAGLPPQARRGRHCDVFSWKIHRLLSTHCWTVCWIQFDFVLVIKSELTSSVCRQ